jgi:hypothetical protein
VFKNNNKIDRTMTAIAILSWTIEKKKKKKKKKKKNVVLI